jgi:hypothetical protein
VVLQKLGIRDYIRTLGVPHTFVEIGWWAQAALPFPTDSQNPTAPFLRRVIGRGDKKSAVTDLAHIAELLERILLDPRTENKTVFCWEDEVTQNEAWDIAAREADEGAAILATRVEASYSAPDVRVQGG